MRNDETTITINLAEYLAPSISTRVAVQAFKNDLEILSANEIHLDFSEVTCISRSAAHELVNARFDLTNIQHKKVFFENMNDLVSNLLSIVTNNTNNSKPKQRTVSNNHVNFANLQKMVF